MTVNTGFEKFVSILVAYRKPEPLEDKLFCCFQIPISSFIVKCTWYKLKGTDGKNCTQTTAGSAKHLMFPKSKVFARSI